MALKRLSLFRNEAKVASFDGQTDDSLLTIKYDPELAGGSRLKPVQNDQDLISAYPIMISEYKVTLQGDFPGFLWQYYCDEVDATAASNYDFTNYVFTNSLKQYRHLTGSRIASTNSTGDVYNSMYSKITLRFKAKSYWSKRHKERRWIVPPIILSGSKNNFFGISVRNLLSAGNIDRTFISLVEMKKWHQIT